MKASIEHKLRSIGTSIADRGSADVFLRGDGKPFRLVKLIKAEHYAVEALLDGGRTVIFDPADMMAVMLPAD